MTMRFVTIGILAISGLAASASAQPRSSGRSDLGIASKIGTPAGRRRASSQAAHRLLRKTIESVDWLDTPFEEVVSWLQDEGEGKVNIVPVWGQLSVESVDRDTLVTLQLNNTTVAEVLIETLDHISPGGELRFRAIANQLKVSTRADFDRKMYIRVYDVTDILFRVPNMGQDAPNIDLQNQTSGGGGGGGGGGGQSVFQGGSQGGGSQQGGEQAEQELEERLEEMKTMIELVIEPTSWNTQISGGRGTIQIWQQSLIVYNTIEVHEQIGGPFRLGE